MRVQLAAFLFSLLLVSCGAKSPYDSGTQTGTVTGGGFLTPAPTKVPSVTPASFTASVTSVSASSVPIVMGPSQELIQVGYFSFYVTSQHPIASFQVSSDNNAFVVQGQQLVNSYVLGVSGYWNVPATQTLGLRVYARISDGATTATATSPTISVSSVMPAMLTVYSVYNTHTGDWLQSGNPGEQADGIQGYDWSGQHSLKTFKLFTTGFTSSQNNCAVPIARCRITNTLFHYLAPYHCDGTGDSPDLPVMGYACLSSSGQTAPAGFFPLYRIRYNLGGGLTGAHISLDAALLSGIIGGDSHWSFDANGTGFQGVFVGQ